MEDPEPLARAYVVASHVAFRVAHRLRRRTGPVRRADDDDVADDERRGVETELGRVEVDLLIVFELQIDGAVSSEGRNRHSGLRVEGQHPVAGRDVDDAPIGAVRAGPVARPRPSAVPGRVLAARALVLGVHPEHLSGGRVECDGRAPRAGRRVEHAVNQQRSGRIERVRTRAQEVGLQSPRDLQRVEVVLRDLVGWRVAMAREIAAVGRPLDDRPARWAVLRMAGWRRRY